MTAEPLRLIADDHGTDANANLARRALLKAGLASGGFVLGFGLPGFAPDAAASKPAGFEPNAFILIGSDGSVTLTMPQVEMGQGIYTAISMLLAEELEVALSQVRLEHAPPDRKRYGNPVIGGEQITGGSTSIRAFWVPMRRAGATARVMLIGAAARRWKVDPSACLAQRGEVIHKASGRRLKYGALAADAARMPVPEPIDLKRPDEFKLIGTPAKRLDTPAKVNGKAIYGIDVRLPGMKVATLAQSPVFGGRLKRVDDAACRAVKGVRQIVRLDDAVAVVADHMGAARKGLAALVIEWDTGANSALSTDDIARELEKGSEGGGAVAQDLGDVHKAIAGAATQVNALYHVPFLAHATMEPMNCTVHVRKDSCEIWVGTQVVARAQDTAAKTTGLPPDKVIVHNHLLGGGFGRRLEIDGVTRAVQIAMQVDGPVKIVWSREEDIQHDMYRPYFVDRMSAGLDAAGTPVAWSHRFAGSSIIARYFPPFFKNGLDSDTTDCAINLPYSIPNFRVEYRQIEPPGIPTAFWRSVGPSHNVFVVESFMDELATVARIDPVAYRLALLDKSPRAKGVLQLAAQQAGWGQALPDRSGRGVALQFAFGSYMAQVAQVAISKDGEVRVQRVVCAVDCGMVVNPDTVKAQVQSAVIFGISAALFGQITLKNGRVEQTNFDSYQVLRIGEAPVIEVHIVQSGADPGGMGEPGTSAIVPAVMNAIHAATGKRLRKPPVDPAELKLA